MSLFALASPSFPLPSDPDSCRPFRPRAHCRASILHLFSAFNLDTGLFRIRLACSIAGETLPFDFNSSFPAISLSLHSVHCIATDSGSAYIIPKPCFAERQANRPSLYHLVCVCVFGATVAQSRLVFSLAFPLLSCHPIRFQPLPFATAVCEPARSTPRYQLTLVFRSSCCQPPAAAGTTNRAHRPSSLLCAFSLRECRLDFIPLAHL